MSDKNVSIPVDDLIAESFSAEGYIPEAVLKTVSDRIKSATHIRHMNHLVASMNRSIESGICPKYKLSEEGKLIADLSLPVRGEVSLNEHTSSHFDVFGTGHELAIDFLLASLSNAVDCKSQDEIVRRLNGALALIKDIAPQDGLEAMLVSQMVATHRAAMSMLGKSGLATTVDGIEIWAKHAHKLLTLYTHQMKALQKHRHGGKQTVVVKHVHVHGGGQAIVGDVTTSSGPKGG